VSHKQFSSLVIFRVIGHLQKTEGYSTIPLPTKNLMIEGNFHQRRPQTMLFSMSS
jgi:hypothetical protein